MTLSFKPAVLVLLCSTGLFAASAMMYAQSRVPETPQPAATTTPAVPVPAPATAVPAAPVAPPSFSSAQIDQWVAPIALYPDPLLSQVLMASTYPANVIQAAQWSHNNPTQQGDAAIQAVSSQPWDPSVKSLVAFPQLMALMGENPPWVENLGDAFLAQPQDVMDSVQKLRRLAQETGSLKSTPQQTVSTAPVVVNQTNTVAAAPAKTTTVAPASTAPQTIIIQPTDPQVVYVPNYNPSTVYGTWPNTSYPPTYLPPPPGQQFTDSLVRGFGYSLGVATTYALFSSIDWHDDDDYYHHGNGHYDGNYRSNNNINVNVNNYNRISGDRLPMNGGAVAWQHNPTYRAGVPYQSNAVAQRYHQTDVAGGLSSIQKAPVNRDAQRQAAQTQLQQRSGNLSGSTQNLSGKNLSGQTLSRDAQRKNSAQQLDQIAKRDNYRGYGNDAGVAKTQAKSARTSAQQKQNLDAAKSKVAHPSASQQQHRDNVKQKVNSTTPAQRQNVTAHRSNALSGNDSRSPSWKAQQDRGMQSRAHTVNKPQRSASREQASGHRELRHRN